MPCGLGAAELMPGWPFLERHGALPACHKV